MLKETKNFVLPQPPREDYASVYILCTKVNIWWPVTVELYIKIFDEADSGNIPLDKFTHLGTIENKEYVYFYLAPGDYSILSKSSQGINQRKLSVKEGEMYFLGQDIVGTSLGVVNDLHLIDDTLVGKYTIKNDKLGKIARKIFP